MYRHPKSTRPGRADGARRARVLLAGAAWSLAVACAQAGERPPTRPYDIPAQPLASALVQVSMQGGVNVVASEEVTRGRLAPAVRGSMTAERALSQVLGPNHLAFASSTNGSYVIKPREAPGKLAQNAAPERRAATADAAPPAAAPDPVAEVGEVVVTAQRREERLLNVPMSVSATSGAELVAAGITSTGDLQQVTPGLLTPSVGLSFTPAIRGVTSISTSPGDETNVALYLDDVYVGASIAGLFEFKDIQRIEVLKGPQGTLFGRNATGGAIRIITLRPSFTPQLQLSADYGVNFDRLKLGGYVTGPVSDKVAASLALNYVNDDGYSTGVGPHAGRRFSRDYSISGRGKVLVQATDDLALTFEGDASSQKNSGIYAWVPRAQNFLYRNTPGAIIPGDYQYAGSTLPEANVNTWGASVTAEWTPPDALSIKSITAERGAYGFYQTDTDRISLSIGSLQLKQNQVNFSQEFIFATPAERRLSFVGGLYYYHSRAWNPYFSTYAGDAPTGTVTTSFTNNVHTDSYAAYGELTLNATDRLHLTLGGRYTVEKKDIDFRFLVRAAGLASASSEHTWRSPTYRAVVRYDLTRDANVYFSASDGFKSGVYNAYAYPLVAVEPETIKAYEAGAKARFGRLTGTLAGFLYNYSNIQVQGQSQIGNAFVVTLTNAAKAEIRGVEAELSGPIDEHLSFDLGVSALPVARYSSYPAAQVFVPQALGNKAVVPYNASGSRAIRSPKFQGDARLNYTNEVAGGRFQGSVSYAYNSGFYFQPGNFSFQDAYGVLNARLAWTEPSGRFTFSVTGENLTDERYSFYTTDSLAGTVDVLARPREIYFGVAAKF